MKDLLEKYDDEQKSLLAQAQSHYNEMAVDIGRRIKPSIIVPGQDVDSPHAVLVRGNQLLTLWSNRIRDAILKGLPEAQDIVGPPTFAMICGVVLGQVCALNDAVEENIPHDVEDIMADAFEGGYILGRLSWTQAIERGAMVVEKNPDGTVKVTGRGPGDKEVH